MKKIMAIDYGDARTGIALSDISGTIAGEAFTISEGSFKKAARRVADEAKTKDVSLLVLGYPKNMDGSLGERARKSEEFAVLLREYSGLEVVLWDERLTTVDAHRILSQTGVRGKKRKSKIDAVAASLILEGYLNSL